jgi:serine/threonine protein kinase
VTALSDTQLSSLQRELALPDLGDRYRLIARLGLGGMGAVYLGHDTLLNRDVA